MAQLIPQETIEMVRQQTNIVDVVGQYVQLKKSGKNYLGLCPFHNEKSPSFSVAEDKQIFHCFGCGKGGNVFSFIQEIEGLSFPESVEKVADLANISVSLNLTNRPQVMSPKVLEESQLIQIHEKTSELYHHILMNTQVGEKALEYLKERGLTEEVIKTFQIGFAPRDRRLLHKVLEKDNYSDEVLKKTGLLFQLEDGNWIDRFYQRIMFPITNFQGKVIGFSGRILEDVDFDATDQPKYLNSPETDLFNKRFILYNFHQSRTEIRKKNEVILFEGFMDVISAWMSGVKNGVASMGTSLTMEQINALEKISDEVLIAYDGDNAGIEATSRAIDLLSNQSSMGIQIISIPDKMDPDDYRRKYGEDNLHQLIKNSRETVFQFKKDYLKRNKNLTIEADKLLYIDELLGELIHVSSIVEVDLALSQLADEFHVSKNTLQNELRTKKQSFKQQSMASYSQEDYGEKEIVIPKHYEVKKIGQVEKAEMTLIFRLLTERSAYQFLSAREDLTFAHDVYQELYLHLTNYIQLHGEIVIADFLDYLKEQELKQVLIQTTMQNFSEESTKQELEDCLLVIKKGEIQERINTLINDQQEARRVGNSDLEAEATLQIIMLQKQLKSI
ncbi:DNA primase [Vagococcus fluvialis]|uniref:DNA primase n=2 Tax=Vagococcus fluvialis TaxID=2738 RepID=A0A369B590_9ENTE|nr:DNA primase [Vagococcus fluvialis]MBO0479029.1 DNA primase [Vagococcus fluvialis]MBO0484103.1 DNA primase [Vagococcus fluvialis]MDT2747292.1 DNA primase [Vagococcus fluvialis]RCX15716.1 DNA primase [Vagococcus fluvialis]RSU04397.1 DNA primase [Vagococcus fluvialis]